MKSTTAGVIVALPLVAVIWRFDILAIVATYLVTYLIIVAIGFFVDKGWIR